jgi:hypothetical protein
VVEILAVTSSSVRDVFRPTGGEAIQLVHQSGAHLVVIAPGIASFSPYLGAFQELRVGERWSNLEYKQLWNCEVIWTCNVSARVVGKERVSVRAGTYDAWKVVIDFQAKPMTSTISISGELVFWFADEPKRFVKYQQRVSGSPSFWHHPQIDMELESYTPAGAR